jgi:hypothetical protein
MHKLGRERRNMLFLVDSVTYCPSSRFTFLKQESSMRYLITIGFMAAALVAYYFGLESGSGILFLAGAIFEIISFKRLRRRSLS